MRGALITILFLAIIVGIAAHLFVVPENSTPEEASNGMNNEYSDYGKFIGLVLVLTFFYFYFQKA